jgi:uncharacterized protein (DUF779 family)
MNVRVRATAEALEVIERLRVAHGTLVFFQSGGCCEGSAPLCLREGEMAPGSGDVRLGEIGGVAFYIDGDQDERWHRPAFVIDVSPGAAEGFSLEASEAVHFVSRSAEGDPVAGVVCADPEEQP